MGREQHVNGKDHVARRDCDQAHFRLRISIHDLTPFAPPASPSFAERYEGWLSVEQVARDFFVNTGTINSWIKGGRIEPSVSFPFGSRTVYLFSPGDVAAIRERLQIPVHDDETIRDDFLAFLEERDYSRVRGKWGTHLQHQARSVRVPSEVCPPFATRV